MNMAVSISFLTPCLTLWEGKFSGVCQHSIINFVLFSDSGVGDHGETGIQTFLKKHECANRCHNLHLNCDGFAEDVREESDEE